jgi:hypothetical protein
MGDDRPIPDSIESLRARAFSGEPNDPRRAQAVSELRFLLAKQELSSAIATERAADRQLDVAERQLKTAEKQERYAFWTAISTAGLVAATLLLVAATLILIIVKTH